MERSGTRRENNHLINWEETSVLDHGSEQELLVKEAPHIEMTPVEECFNQDGGLGNPWLLDHSDEEARTTLTDLTLYP